MLLSRTIVSLVILLAMGELTAQQAVITGKSPQFRNEDLYIRTISNPVTGESTVSDTLVIHEDGSFHLQLECHALQWIFMNAGIFRIMMLIEPGKGYEITLPPRINKKEQDIRNPFFQPVFAHIQVTREFLIADPESSITGTDINSRIFRFDTLINASKRELLEAARLHRSLRSDSMIVEIERNYAADSSDYFKKYRKFRYGILKITSRDVGLEYLQKEFLDEDRPLIHNPAYMELFNEMYGEFLFYFSRTGEGKSVPELINRRQDLDALEDTMMNHPAVPNRQIAELIIIKEIFDIYFRDYFYRDALLMLLDSVIAHPQLPEFSEYAQGVKEVLTRLKVGEVPPDFHLLDRDNQYRSLEDYKGKYVYLNFCTADNYSCLKEFPFLDAIYNVHHDYLEVVTVMVTETQRNMVEFMDRNNYKWTALFYGNDENVLQDYDVRTFPTNYLLDREGKLIQSPAALATEGLEQQLFRIMRSRGDL